MEVQTGKMVNFYRITLMEHAKLVADLFNAGRRDAPFRGVSCCFSCS